MDNKFKDHAKVYSPRKLYIQLFAYIRTIVGRKKIFFSIPPTTIIPLPTILLFIMPLNHVFFHDSKFTSFAPASFTSSAIARTTAGCVVAALSGGNPMIALTFKSTVSSG